MHEQHIRTHLFKIGLTSAHPGLSFNLYSVSKFYRIDFKWKTAFDKFLFLETVNIVIRATRVFRSEETNQCFNV